MVKKILFALILFPLFLTAQDISPSFFYGKWEGSDANELGQIELNKDGYASFLINGQVFGGSTVESNAPKVELKYTINLEIRPIQIDFTAVKLESGDSKQLLGIIEVVDNNTIKLALNFDEGRPDDFEDDDTVTLSRK